MAIGALSLIGNTPLIRVQQLDTGKCELYLKLESQNPGGSIKDRIGLSMIEVAEREGKIGPGSRLVEATAGNTGLGLALVAARKGYRLTLVIPDKMSQEKIFHLRALGAEVVLTRSDVGKGHGEYYQDIAEAIAKKDPKAYFINQFGNPANSLAHETTTGPEIWSQMDHDVDAICCGVGSGGTMAGLTAFFRRVSPNTEMILADPEGSILVDYVKTGKFGQAGSWLVEGIGEDFIPPIADLSAVRAAYTIPDRESFEMARQLLQQEGVLGGSSSGTLLAAALRFCREQTTKKRVVTFVCDSGNKYLSKMFNDYWMADQGFLEEKSHGDLRDLVGRSHEKHAAIVVQPLDTLQRAFQLMKLYDVSQLPVLEGDRVVGLLHESDLLLAVTDDMTRFRSPVREHMSKQLETLPIKTPISALTPIFNRGLVAIVVDGDRFVGLVTRFDLLNSLRRKLK
jgi:cystathionine beta-synthase